MKELEWRTFSENALKIIECLNKNGWERHILCVRNDGFCFRYEKGNIYAQIERFVLFKENSEVFYEEAFIVWSSDDDTQTFSCNQLDTVSLGVKEEFGDRKRYCEFYDKEADTIVHLHYESDNPKITYFR